MHAVLLPSDSRSRCGGLMHASLREGVTILVTGGIGTLGCNHRSSSYAWYYNMLVLL